MFTSLRAQSAHTLPAKAYYVKTIGIDHLLAKGVPPEDNVSGGDFFISSFLKIALKYHTMRETGGRADMDTCEHKKSGRNCPISKTPCLGECIYANILDDISLGIIGLDVGKKEVFFQNKVAAELFRSTIRPKDYHALVSLLHIDNAVMTGDPAVSRTVRYGSKFIGFTIYRITDTYLWIYVSNITEKVRLDAIAEAVNTMNNLGYIFSGIRHELGNPVNSIKTTISVLKSKIDTCSRETIAEYIDRALADLNRVEHLLKDLKNFSMFENPDLKNVRMGSFMDNLLSIVERDFNENRIRIRTIIRPEAEWGFFDPRALQHVILNLLTNASDALQGRESPEIVISVFRVGGRVVMKVKDNGCGIGEDQKTRLFKPFTTTKANGTGLGLVIVKKTMSKMDGTVQIESQENVGTVVTLDLPEGHP
jgi:signal transduction histidine kinase